MTKADKLTIEAKKLASQFNEKYEIGEPLTYVNDFGVEENTILRSKAWVAGSSAIALFEGFTGGYDIKRVKGKKIHGK